MLPSGKFGYFLGLEKMTEDLKRFIEGFEDEDALRRAVEALLMKMPGCTNVRATHGPQEYGKDIVFCSKGPMGEVLLVACVIKNDKITGSADSTLGARTVFHQVAQSLDTPISNEQGESQTISRAYVITPHECPPSTMESISGALKARFGQVAFICGNDLLIKFKRFWPEFLLTNVKFLGAHVKSLRDELDKDPAVARLLFKEGFSTAKSQGLGMLYVQPRLACMLRMHELRLRLPEPQDFEQPMREQEAARLARTCGNFARLVAFLKGTTDNDPERIRNEIVGFAADVREMWESGYNVYRTRPGLSDEQRGKSKAETAATLAGASLLRERWTTLLRQADPLIAKVRKHLAVSNGFVTTVSNNLRNPDPSNPKLAMNEAALNVIHSEEIRDFYTVSDMSRQVPSLLVAAHSVTKVQFDRNLLDRMTVPLLITGPPGYGKTSFCRQNALRDLKALETGSSKILPVYIQLHQLAGRSSTSFQDLFLPSEELRVIWKEINNTQSTSPWILRLYLDGLDEVPEQSRQIEITNIAASGATGIRTQIIMTARDHIKGPWLSWLRRLDIQPFNEGEIRQLVTKWLSGNPLKVGSFYQKLQQVPSLASLMKVPLLGTLILAVYKHAHEGLPESRPRLYDMFVRLLAGGWDAAKNINRGSKFNSQTKVAVLSHLAGVLHNDKKRDCSIGELKAALAERVFGLQKRTEEFLSELIADGLLVPTGSILSFPHLSFQEFLAAKDLVQLRPDRANQRLDNFLRGDDWWREVVTFYVSFHDKPSEMEEWIRSGVVRNIARAPDDLVRGRAIELCQVVLTNFSDFQFSEETRRYLNWYSEPAFKIGETKIARRSAGRVG